MTECNAHCVCECHTGPAARRIEEILQTSRIGLAIASLLNAADELRRRLKERGDDADTILTPLDESIGATFERIDKNG